MTSLKTSAYSDCGVLCVTNPIDESNLVYQKKRKNKNQQELGAMPKTSKIEY